MIMHWLRLFRVVNLPTVPGDVLVGAAVAVWWCGSKSVSPHTWLAVALAAASSCFLYLYGLVDNDIVGSATDSARPIPDGEISMRAAKTARAVCLALGLLPAVALELMHALSHFLVALALASSSVAYNRSKRPTQMGLCRGLNVVLGVVAVAPPLFWPRLAVRAPFIACAAAALVAVCTAYIAAVTKYSEGEELDPARRTRVGRLIGGIVYLQLSVLIVLAIVNPCVNPLLLAGAVLLLLLRASRRAFPKVSAS